MSTLVELRARLEEAEKAYHQLMTGQMAVVVVDQNGERVEYARSNAYRLRAYIAELKAEIARLEGTPPAGPLIVWM